jgi:hypothetical protein
MLYSAGIHAFAVDLPGESASLVFCWLHVRP